MVVFRPFPDRKARVPQTGTKGAYLKQQLKDKLIEHRRYIDKHGVDMPEIQIGNEAPK